MNTLTVSAAAANNLTVTIDTGASVTLQDTDSDGYYEIGTADELYAFAALVDGGKTAINGKLTADIVVNEGTMTADSTDARVWNPIGYYNSSSSKVTFTGTFDGQGHTVSGLYFNNSSTDMVGLVTWVGEGGKVQNVGIINSYLSGRSAVGGVAGRSDGTVTGCYNTGTITGNNTVGGIAGIVSDGTINNCSSIGSVQADSSVGGITGWIQNTASISNCFSAGTVEGTSQAGGVAGYAYNGASTNATIANCYYDNSSYSGSAVGQNGGSSGSATLTKVEGKTTEQFASGEVAFLLGDGFGQNLDNGAAVDAYPVFSSAAVYQGANTGCLSHGEYVYSNTNEAAAVPHEYTNGICSCGKYEEAVQNADGYYEIGNLGQLMWFAQNVNTAHNALLTADITIDNSVVWTPITLQDGTANSSIFNGGGHTITFANTNEGSTFGLFSKYNYSIIENLYLAGSITCNTEGDVGVLVNSAYRTTIRNVISTCDITNSAASGGVGGLAGQFGGQDSGRLYSLIENCAVYADVSGGGSAGGLIGNIWAGYHAKAYFG